MDFTIIKNAAKFTWNEIGNKPWTWFKLAIITFLLVIAALSVFVIPFVTIVSISFPTIGAATSLLKALKIPNSSSLGVALWFMILSCLAYVAFYINTTIYSIPDRNVLDRLENKKLRMFKNRITTHKLTSVRLLYIAIVVISTLFFIIPGIIVAVRYNYTYWVLLDEKCNIFEAFSKSWKLTKDKFFQLLITTVIVKFLETLRLVNIIFPITSLFEGSIYQQLNTIQKQTTSS